MKTVRILDKNVYRRVSLAELKQITLRRRVISLLSKINRITNKSHRNIILRTVQNFRRDRVQDKINSIVIQEIAS